MQRGLGRCYTQLSACKNKEKYRKTVLYGCLHNLSYELQSEGTRAEYVYELCSLFGDTDYFLNEIIKKFEKLPASHGDYEHLCDLLYVFAAEGAEEANEGAKEANSGAKADIGAEARAALDKKYAELYVKLINNRRPTKIDCALSNFERVAVNLVWLDGLSAFLKIAEDIGNLFLQNKNYDANAFDWFYISFRDEYGKDELNKALYEKSQTSPAINKFYEISQAIEADLNAIRQSVNVRPKPTAEELLKLVEEGNAEKRHFVRFGRLADEEQKRILAERVMQESDQNKQAKLLQAFMHGGFPLGVDGLADLFEHANQNLRFAITDVLEETVDPQAHDIAVDFIKMDGNYVAGIKMLIKNYSQVDKALLILALNNIDLKKSAKTAFTL